MASEYPRCVFGAAILFVVTAGTVGQVREGPDCRDNIPNCGANARAYNRRDICDTTKDPVWPRENCEAYCGLCKRTTPCADARGDCKSLGPYVCQSDNVPWGQANCERTCGFCYDTYQDPQVTTTSDPGSQRSVSGVSLEDRESIVRQINGIRSNVQPPARDMTKVSWDQHLEEFSQKITDTCVFEVPFDRKVKPYGSTWIGVLGVTDFEQWNSTIDFWASAKQHFKYGQEPDSYLGVNKWSKIASYTQMVTNEVVRVGCGYTYCKNEKKPFYLCAFLTGQKMKRPYESGPRCADCAGRCVDGLCHCEGLLCLHGLKMDLNCCKCY